MSKTINTTAAINYFSGWGLKPLNAELASRGMPEVEDPKMAATVIATSIRTLDELTATALNLSEGTVDRDELHKAFVECFPEHTIGERHVAHYLSLARKGNLQGTVECRFAPPKAARKTKSKFKVAIDVRELSDEQRTALEAAGIELPAIEE